MGSNDQEEESAIRDMASKIKTEEEMDKKVDSQSQKYAPKYSHE